MSTISMLEIEHTLLSLYPALALDEPLSVGCGTQMRESLSSYYSADDIEEFIKYYFSHEDYLLSIIGKLFADDKRRMNLDGTPSLTEVTKQDCHTLAFNPTVYLSPRLTDDQKAFCKKMRNEKIRYKNKLKKRVSEMNNLGFSTQTIINKLGKKALEFSVTKDFSTQFKKEDIESARSLSENTLNISKSELVRFQKNMLRRNVPTPLILLASSGREDYVYHHIFKSGIK